MGNNINWGDFEVYINGAKVPGVTKIKYVSPEVPVYITGRKTYSGSITFSRSDIEALENFILPRKHVFMLARIKSRKGYRLYKGKA